MASEGLRAACMAELSRLNLPSGGVTTEVGRAGRWRVTLTVRGRTFYFGTMGRNGFFFVEIAPEREEDLTAALPPASQDQPVLWRYAFWLLERAVNSPRLGGIDRPVI